MFRRAHHHVGEPVAVDVADAGRRRQARPANGDPPAPQAPYVDGPCAAPAEHDIRRAAAREHDVVEAVAVDVAGDHARLRVARGGAGDPEAARAAQRARRALAPEDDAHAVVREQHVGDAVAVHVAGARRMAGGTGGAGREATDHEGEKEGAIRQACRSP